MKMENAISWFEIPASDLKRARTFYETIFQIELTDFAVPNGLKMALFPVEPGKIGGALAHHPDFYVPSHDGTLIYLNGNPDLGIVLARVESAGGKVLVPKTQISEQHGYMAVFEDSEGNRIAIHSVG